MKTNFLNITWLLSLTLLFVCNMALGQTEEQPATKEEKLKYEKVKAEYKVVDKNALEKSDIELAKYKAYEKINAESIKAEKKKDLTPEEKYKNDPAALEEIQYMKNVNRDRNINYMKMELMRIDKEINEINTSVDNLKKMDGVGNYQNKKLKELHDKKAALLTQKKLKSKKLEDLEDNQ